MGTRGLTMVIKDDKPVVAQYGQWDHYPSGQGCTALSFLSSSENVTKLRNNLDKIQFMTAEQADARAIKSGKFSNWPSISMAESQYFNLLFKYMSRDHGAKILSMIAESDDDVINLTDSSDFVNDSLFCEWAYVVDFDTNTFEIYSGFSTDKNEGRFASDVPTYKEYFPVTLVKYSLDALPDEATFIAECDPEENDA